MKKHRTLLKKLLCFGLLLCLGASVLPVAVLAAGTALTAAALVNLYDSATALKGGFPSWENGAVVEKSPFNHNTSAYIAVNPGDVITFAPAELAQDIHLQGYSDPNTIVDVGVTAAGGTGSNKKLVQKGVLDSTYGILEYTVPAGVYGVRIINRPAVDSRFLITKNQSFTVEMYCEKYDLTPPASSTPTTPSNPSTVTYPFKANNPSQSVLYQKSVVFIGDSICNAKGDSYKGYGGQIGNAYSMTWYNRGISGAAVYNGRKYGQIANQLWVDASKQIDYVIMQGMINDAINAAPIGTMTSGFDPDAFNNATFAGGLENMFYTARKYYPNATYGFIINYSCPYKTGYTDNLTSYVNMAKQICEKYKIPYLDLCNDADFCNNVLKINTTEFLTDKLHPNKEGHTLLAQKIAPWMETLTRQSLTGIADKTEGPLYGKSALFVGDSILQADTDRACDDGSWRIYPSGKRSWAGRIGFRNNMTFVNAGKSGAKISKCDNQILTQLSNNKNSTFDYVILWGGINDAWQYTRIGTLSDSQSYDDFNQSTFYGALEATFCRVKEWYPDATYAYIIPYTMPKASDGSSAVTTLRNNFGPYVEAIKAACEKWDIPYLNLYEDTDFCDNVLKTGTSSYYFKDGIHPFTPGHDLLALKIEPFMEQLEVRGGDDGNGSSQTPPDNGDGNGSGDDSSQTPTNPPADNTDNTPEPTTTAPADTAADDKKSRGCGAALSATAGVLATTALAGTALCLPRKKKRK